MGEANAYSAGIDLGTTFTAAAIHRNGVSEMVNLGAAAAAVPSVIAQTDSGWVYGETAVDNANQNPLNVARNFKRRIGDPVPIHVAGNQIAAEELSAQYLKWVLVKIVEREGQPPARLTLTHPANWGNYRLDLFRSASKLIADCEMILAPEPHAAAVHYATREHLETDGVVCVYDLGGGTFDCSLLRRTSSGAGFEQVGSPQGIASFGGVDLDEDLARFVLQHAAIDVDELDHDDAVLTLAMAGLRRDITQAKRALSESSAVTVNVILPSVAVQVRVTRREFEDLIRLRLLKTVDVVVQTIAQAGLEPVDIDRVLLIGGSSRVPLVGQLLAQALGRPIAVDADPKHAVALGAAIIASTRRDGNVVSGVDADSGFPALKGSGGDHPKASSELHIEAVAGERQKLQEPSTGSESDASGIRVQPQTSVPVPRDQPQVAPATTVSMRTGVPVPVASENVGHHIPSLPGQLRPVPFSRGGADAAAPSDRLDERPAQHSIETPVSSRITTGPLLPRRRRWRGWLTSASIVGVALGSWYGTTFLDADDGAIEMADTVSELSTRVGDTAPDLSSKLEEEVTPDSEIEAEAAVQASDTEYGGFVVGDCLRTSDFEAGLIWDLVVVPCSIPHVYEVYHVFEPDDPKIFPGGQEVASLANDGCLDAFDAYVGRAYYSSELMFSFWVSSKEEWNGGLRRALCTVEFGDGTQLDGSVKGTGR